MFSFQCGAHGLHLIVQKFVKSDNVKPVIKKGQKWAKRLHKSGPTLKLFKSIQEKEDVPPRVLPTVRKRSFEIIT
jgi:hypothetical protein